MLASPLVLAGVFVNQRLEPDRDFRVVLETPQTLDQGRELLRQFSPPSAVRPTEGAQSLPSPEIILVLVQDKVLRQDLGVAQTLEDGVDEAGVAVVPDPHHAGHHGPVLEVVTPFSGSLLRLG